MISTEMIALSVFIFVIALNNAAAVYLSPMKPHPSTDPWFSSPSGVYTFRTKISASTPCVFVLSSSMNALATSDFIEVRIAVSPGGGRVASTFGGNTVTMGNNECRFFNTPRNVGVYDDYWVIYRASPALGATLSFGSGPTPGKGRFLLACQQGSYVKNNLTLPRTSASVLSYFHVANHSAGVKTSSNWFGKRSGVLAPSDDALAKIAPANCVDSFYPTSQPATCSGTASAKPVANALLQWSYSARFTCTGGLGGPPVLVLPVDLDGDMDLDLYIIDEVDNLKSGRQSYLYRRDGPPDAPVYVKPTGWLPTATTQCRPSSAQYEGFPEFVDIDNDGDLDIVCAPTANSGPSPIILSLHNGNLLSPTWTTALSNPFAGFNITGGTSSTATYVKMVDFDGDGDFDLYGNNGANTGKVYLENVGTAASPSFRLVPKSMWPTFMTDVFITEYGVIKDFDGDGDFDIVTGTRDNDFVAVLFENMGNKTWANFVVRSGSLNPYENVKSWNMLHGSLLDSDFDGDLDLLYGDYVMKQAGFIDYLENVGDVSQTLPVLTQRISAPSNLLHALPVQLNNKYAGAAVGDLDGDGDGDLLISYADGSFKYYTNIGSQTIPSFKQASVPTGLLNYTVDVPIPSFVDLDGDGDLDLCVGVLDSAFGGFKAFYYENIGTVNNPIFLRKTANNPFAPFSAQTPSTLMGDPLYSTSIGLSFGDVDNDGDYDVVSCSAQTGFSYGYAYVIHLNVGNATHPLFTQFDGTNPNCVQLINWYPGDTTKDVTEIIAAPAFSDLDNDGDLDVIVPSKNSLRYLINNGNLVNLSFSIANFTAFTEGILNATSSSSGCDPIVYPYDLDGDGADDFIIACGAHLNYGGQTALTCSDKCNGNGACLNGRAGDFGQCSCFSGYFGARCDGLCQFSADGQICSGFGACYTGAKPSLLGQCLCQTGYAGTKCGQCAPGYWNYPNCTLCASTCNARGFCNATDGACVCNPGYSGTTCNIGGCPTGKGLYNDVCVPCPVGTSKNVQGDVVCSECPPGMFQDQTGQTSCNACPANSQPDSKFVRCLCDRGFVAVPGKGTGSVGLKCVACPPGYRCDKPDLQIAELTSVDGWWFRPVGLGVNASSIPSSYECPFSTGCALPKSFTVSNGTGMGRIMSDSNQICTTGYTGVVCAVCAKGYYLTDSGCELCNTSGVIGPMVIGVFALIIIAGCVIKKGRKEAFEHIKGSAEAVKAKRDQVVAKREEIIAKAEVKALDIAEDAVAKDKENKNHKRKAALFGLVAIFISFAQVIGSMSGVFSIPWPQFYEDASAWLATFLGDFFSRTGTACFDSSYNFYSSLRFITITPFVLWAILGFGLVFINKTVKDENELQEKENKIFFYATTLMTLVYPAMSVKAFRTFMCKNVNGVMYLEADYTLKCGTSEHGQHVAWATFVVIFISAGWPLFLASFLTFLNRQDKLNDEGVKERYGHLYSQYEDRWYFWESVDSVRKLILTSAIVFFGKGTMLQTIIGCFVAFCAHLAHALTNPYVDSSADELQHSALGTIWLTLFAGIIMYMPTLNSQDAAVLGALSLVCQWGVIGFSALKTFTELKVKLSQVRENKAKFQAEEKSTEEVEASKEDVESGKPIEMTDISLKSDAKVNAE